MQPTSQVSYSAHFASPASQFSTGVSLHSHTSHSIESLTFIHAMFLEYPALRPIFRYYERVSRQRHGVELDFLAAHWRPPLVPRMAFDLESRQIRALGLHPLVSITDHDDIQAPLLLRTVPSARHIPMSLEWTVPFGPTSFHVGVHNLPSNDALLWMDRLAAFTANPQESNLLGLFEELNGIPQVLIVLNHPMWDLHKIGDAAHARELDRFLEKYNHLMHALELNALRHARENQQVRELAPRWSQLLISGGDRHGLEPNANINLTNAANFTDFVREIRVERRSHVLFLPQYSRPWEQRILESTLDAVVDHPHFSPGWQRWDERAFHPDRDGVMRPMAELWHSGRAPRLLRTAIGLVRLSRYRTISAAIRIMLPKVQAAIPDASREVA